jgi:hypothetical protein
LRSRGTKESFVELDGGLTLELVHFLLSKLRLQLSADLHFDIVKRLELDLVHPDNVVAELGLHRVAELSGLQRKRGILEWLHHLAALERGPQIPTCGR